MHEDDQTGNPLMATRDPTHFGDAARVTAESHGQAAPAETPDLPAALKQAAMKRKGQIRSAEDLERRSMLRGLLILALVVLLFSLLRAGTQRAFPAGWWR